MQVTIMQPESSTILPNKSSMMMPTVKVDDANVCGREFSPYERINPADPDVCYVYCVPAGRCEEQVQKGHMTHLKLNGPGGCEHRGFTERGELGDKAEKALGGLALEPACEGISHLKFKRPRVCGAEEVAFEHVDPSFPDACLAYCVPEGACLGEVQSGRVPVLGSIREGDCRGLHFTEPAEFGAVTKRQEFMIKYMSGPCKHITTKKFVKSSEDNSHVEEPAPALTKPRGPEAPKAGAVCGKEMTAFESIAPQFPELCTVYCVPDGPCLGGVQGGAQIFSITGEGNCKHSGYKYQKKDVTDIVAPWLKFSVSECRGTVAYRFTKSPPAEVDQDAVPAAAEEAAPAAPEATPETAATEGVERRAPIKRRQPASFCGSELMRAFEAHSPAFPDNCGVYCVPEGECVGMVEAGKLSMYKITREGGCREKGFSEKAKDDFKSKTIVAGLRYMQGPCKGMTYMRFQRPNVLVAGEAPSQVAAFGENPTGDADPAASAASAPAEAPSQEAAPEENPSGAAVPAAEAAASAGAAPAETPSAIPSSDMW